MTAEELEHEISESIKKILESPEEMDIIIVDIKSQKRGQSLTNMQIQNAMVAAGLNLLFQKHSKEELAALKKAAKFEIIKAHLD